MPQYPFLHPTETTPYNPGNMGPGSSEIGQMLAMFAGPMMSAMAGLGNFVPHLMPTQAVMDQHSMRAYQNDARVHMFNADATGDASVATRLLGGRSAVTDSPATQLNREQAQQMASMINNPVTKAVLGSVVGPERLEAVLHGSKGDVGELAKSVNKMGYFRPDPTGGGRMSAQGLQNYSTGIYNELYESHGNIDQLADDTRANKPGSAQKLKKAARAEQKEIVNDDTVATRLEDLDDSKTRVDQLYKKYVAGGTATDLKSQAKELTKFDRAVTESGVLSETEITVGDLKKRAEKTATNDMHGFMAGQVGKLAEDMFQRGKLPQALGSMSAADRVKLIQSSGRDEETMDKLASDYGHHELMKDKKYSEKTEEGQKEELESKKAGFKETLRGTFKELDKAQKGEAGAKSVEDLEQLSGMGVMSGNVDAKRTATAIKSMTGSLAAVREIFGDNGNPNAPMPALLAALEHLSGGAGSQVSGGKVETALRQMQTLAKESGIGFEQLASMSADMDATGEMLGVAKGTTLEGKAGVMSRMKVMRNSGAFSTPVYGAMSQEEAMTDTVQRVQRGNASTNARGMATLAALYDASTTTDASGNKVSAKYKDSEMEAAVKAYNDPGSGGDYSFKDPTTGKMVNKNIREVIGKGGIQAAGMMHERAGGNTAQFSTTYYDPRTKKYVKSDFGIATQRHEATRDMNAWSTSGRLKDSMASFVDKNPASELAKLSKEEKAKLAIDAGEAITSKIIDTSMMNPAEQITHMQENMESTLTDVFKKRGHANPAAAAKEAAAAMIGTDPAEQREKLQGMIAGANAHYGARTGGKALVTLTQGSGKKFDNDLDRESHRSATIADRKARFGAQESGPLQSMSDYLFEIAHTGEKFTKDGLLKAMAKSIPNNEMRQTFADEMTGGFTALQEATRKASWTNDDIDAIAAGGDIKKLRELAGMKTDPADKDYVPIVDDTTMDARRVAAQTAALKTDDQVNAAYKHHIGPGGGTVAEKRAELLDNSKFKKSFDPTLLQSGERSVASVVEDAKKEKVGKGKTAADDIKLEDLDKIRTAFGAGESEDKIKTGVTAAIRQFGVTNSSADQTARLKELVLRHDEGAGAALQKELDTMTFQSDEHRAQFTAIAKGIQTSTMVALDSNGFRTAADPQTTPPPGRTPDPAQKAAAAAADSAVAPAKQQTWVERLLNLPGTIDAAPDAKPDRALTPPTPAPAVTAPEIEALKKERAAIQVPMSADDAYMAQEEAAYASNKKDAIASGRADVIGSKEYEELKLRREAIVARRVAKKTGVDVRGKYEHRKATDGTGRSYNEYRLGDKVLDTKLMHEGLGDFAHGELQQDQFPETGETPYSPEAQKIIAVDEKLEQEKKKQEKQHAAAVKTANDQAIVQQATGMSPEDIAAAGEEPTGATAPSPEQNTPTKDKTAPVTPKASGDSAWESITKKAMAAANSALSFVMPDVKQGAQAGQPGGMSSRTVDPAAAAGKGGDKQELTINGTLSLQGLTEAIVNARGTQPVATEGAGAPIVVGPPGTPISQFAPKSK